MYSLTYRWLVLLVPIIFVGCSDGRPARVPVAGIVMIDKQPLTAGGNIVFRPQTGRPSAAQIDTEGRFRLGTFEIQDGCPPGDYTVTVSSMDKIGANQRRWNIPKKYHQAATSDIKQTIEGPKEDLVIDLAWEKGQKGPLIEQAEATEDP